MLLVGQEEGYLACKKVLLQQCSWLTMTAWWQHAGSKSGTLIVTGEMLP